MPLTEHTPQSSHARVPNSQLRYTQKNGGVRRPQDRAASAGHFPRPKAKHDLAYFIQTLSVDPCRSVVDDAAPVGDAASVDDAISFDARLLRSPRGEREMELAKSLAIEKTEGRFELGDAPAGWASTPLASFREPVFAIFHRAAAFLGMRSVVGEADGERSPPSNDVIETARAMEGFFHIMETTLLGCASRRASLMAFARLSSFSVPCRGRETQWRGALGGDTPLRTGCYTHTQAYMHMHMHMHAGHAHLPVVVLDLVGFVEVLLRAVEVRELELALGDALVRV